MTVLKVCGATTTDEVDQAAAGGADLVGLWYAVTGGAHDLADHQVVDLAGRCRRRGVEPVLVTFSHDVDDLARLVASAGVGHVQLHAYQPPRVAARLAQRCDGLRVIKVLHLDRSGCPEVGFLGAYERAGVNTFLIDRTADGRVGSTGTEVGSQDFAHLADKCRVPVWLAGGVSAGTDPQRIGRIRAHPGFTGVDVDGAARSHGHDHSISSAAVAGIARAWGAGRRPQPTSQDEPSTPAREDPPLRKDPPPRIDPPPQRTKKYIMPPHHEKDDA